MSAASAQPFRPRTLMALLGVAAVAFVAMAYFAIGDDSPRGDHESAGTTSASRSAVGYRAFIELLRQFEPSVVSRMTRTDTRAALRLLLAPADSAEVRYVMATRTGPVVIVLPKWRTQRDGLADRVRAARLLPTDTIRDLAREIAGDIEIVRPEAVTGWRGAGIAGTPTLLHPQLVASPRLCPLLSADDGGILVGRLCARPDVVVLADPDLLANHGLWRGENAAVAMSLVDRVRGTGRLILALESDAAAAAASRSLWSLALTPPFLAITVALGVALGVALWMAAIRFGPAAKETAGPAAGVFTLIDVGAGLLHARRHGGRVLRRYAELQALDLGRRLHAPRTVSSPGDIGVWADGAGRRRIPGPGYAEMMREVDEIERAPQADPAAVAGTAGRLFRWWKESLNGR